MPSEACTDMLWILAYGSLLRKILSKHIFMCKVQNFHEQTKISMAKNRTFWFSAHGFMVKMRYALTNLFSWAKYASFHGQTELVVCNKMVMGRSCE